MFKRIDLQSMLVRLRHKTRKQEDTVISETNRILKQDLFAESKILQNLGDYNRSFRVLDEEGLDDETVFTESEIKTIAIEYRLKFLESGYLLSGLSNSTLIRIKKLNETFHKNVDVFYVLAMPGGFTDTKYREQALLFAKTNYDNYCLVDSWGRPLKWYRKWAAWPIRNFETLFVTVIACTLLITLSLPTWLITLDRKATYWSGYRVGTFFHLLIFNMGVTAFITFAFTFNFSSSVWNRRKDFD